MRKAATDEMSERAFWAAIQKSADLVRGAPAWTQAGLVLSENFEGPHGATERPQTSTPRERS